MSCFERNLQEISECFPYMLKQFSDLENERQKQEDNERVFWDIDLENHEIMGFVKDGYTWYFSSRYRSHDMIEKWCELHKREDYFAPILIFGMADGEYLLELRKKNPENQILVYEPSEKIFMELIHKKDMSSLIADEKVIITFGDTGLLQMSEWLGICLEYTNFEYTESCILPNYKSAFPMEYLRFQKIFLEALEAMIFQRNTLVKLEKSSQENFFSNVKDSIRQHSISELVAEFPRICNTKEVPAVLVSAGPSLDKNVHELERAKNRAFILSVDTAVGTLLEAGIVPNLMITIDPMKDIFLFEHKGIEAIPMVLSPFANHKVIQIHGGMHFYSQRESAFLTELYESHGKEVTRLDTGGSVANDAFSLLYKMGFQTIILVGQDLAYPDNQSHARKAYSDKVHPDEDGKNYFEVEDIHGSKVLTRLDMNHYRRWFENKIRGMDEIKVIDATEGGAKIEGTEVMTLREAVDRECKGEFTFDQMLRELSPSFSETQQRELLAKLDQLPEQVREAELRLKEGIKDYETFDRLNRKGKYKSKEFRDAYQKITELNQWLNTDVIVGLISDYTNKDEYEVQSRVYDRQDNIYEEICHIIKNGLHLVNAYLDKVPLLLDNIAFMNQEGV